MLGPIVFVVAFLLALGGALLANSARAANGAWSATVGRYTDAAMADGVADFTHGLGVFVARHGTAGPWPTTTSVSAPRTACDPQQSGPTCAFHYVISGTVTDASAAAARLWAVGNDNADNVQASLINEQRLSAIVKVTVSGPGGTVATRTRFLTYRIFTTAPYAVVSGARDITTVDGAQTSAQGDSGGEAPAPGEATPAAQASGQPYDDTRIHVQLDCRSVIPNVVPFENDQQTAGNDGLPWGNAPQAAYEAPCITPAELIDTFRNERWSNGDANASGWTQ